MKENIPNINNFEKLTQLRQSLNAATKLPPKNSIVKLIPLEYLEQGVKVLIDGKLFIAFINEKIKTKEEIIAIVKNTTPFQLSLSLNSQYHENKSSVIQQIIKKFNLPNNEFMQNMVGKVIESDNILIKSKILTLSELTEYVKVNGLELNLLINLIWHLDKGNKNYIEDLHYNLFDESFEDVCKNLFHGTIELLYSNLPQYITQKIRDSLLFNERENNTKTLIDKSKAIIELIVLLNKYSKAATFSSSSSLKDFIKYGTKYIFQKSILKEYDYYPDFVIIEREDNNELIQYQIKKIYNNSDNPTYKIKFSNERIPFKISGTLKENLLIGNIEVDNCLIDEKDMSRLKEKLQENWQLNSDIKLNEDYDKSFNIKGKKLEVNKLI
ncbi:MAG: hypothetical protein CR986_01425 [Ignavibacteriae bacterium]|nr:MAG: hypothetical protein CR986_01425 [Ignavibacteriota bacterium]